MNIDTGDLSYDEEVEAEERDYYARMQDDDIGYQPPRATDEHYARWFAQQEEVDAWHASQRQIAPTV